MSLSSSLVDVTLVAVPVAVFVLFMILLSAAGGALLGANRTKLHHMERSGDPRVVRLVALTADKAHPVSAVRLARLIATVLATVFGMRAILAYEDDAFSLCLFALVAVLLAVLLDMVPRVVAALRPERSALRLLPLIEACSLVLGPVIDAIEVIVTRPIRAFRGEAKDEELTAHEELREAVDLLHREGEVVKSDRDMVGGVLDLPDLTLADLMVHRTKMVMLDAGLPTRELLRAVLASPYTRHPLYRDEPENIVGVLHTKDLVRAIDRADGDHGKVDAAQLASPPWFVPDTTNADAQLNAFLKRKIHMALVVDEYGDVQGLVTLEDIIEEIVGEIADEQDVVVQGVRPFPDGSANVDGSVPVRDLNRMMDWRLPDDEATTIAGLVIHEARMIPDPGQSFTFHGFRFRVLRRQRNRITALKVTPVERVRRDGA
ncbi:HlyC/CorC family transporter [Oryzibacter oryziterrae]|uniref:HlyC/CorC family transporter n=1 Tax=Oryzibacter oryziterrae TaxID=2766474 RepID=UPI001F398B92|nr:CNNM domain-containing protein [Oryzibacter oryziterrae]